MRLKRFFKVGKNTMIKMTSLQNTYTSTNETDIFTSTTVKRKEHSCANCVMYKKYKEYTLTSEYKNSTEHEKNKVLKYFNRYCDEYCSKVENNTYATSNIKYHVGKRERLSRLQLCQLLLYYALGPDEKGIVRNISEKEVASILGCTTRTIRNNNKRLIELNYLLLSWVSKNKYNVLLLDYESQHLTAQEGGRGYITMSNNLFMQLIKIKNVNSLRLEIRNLVKFDDQNVKRIKTRKASYTYKNIRAFLPSYINYQIIKNKIIKEASNIFHITKTNEGIIFTLKSEYNAKLQKKKISKEYEKYFLNYCVNKNMVLSKKDYDDLIQMSFEYRFTTVIDALSIVYKNYYLKDVYIENYGGLVREIIENNLHKKITA